MNNSGVYLKFTSKSLGYALVQSDSYGYDKPYFKVVENGYILKGTEPSFTPHKSGTIKYSHLTRINKNRYKMTGMADYQNNTRTIQRFYHFQKWRGITVG